VFMSLVLSLALHAAPKVDPKLVGTWTLANEPFMTLNANGTGLMDEGKVKWTADGSSLVVTDDEGTADKAGYKVDGDTLVMTMSGIPLTLTRAGAGVQVKKQGALAAKAAKANAVSEADADKEALAEAQVWLQKNGQGQPQQPGRGALQQGQPQQPRAAGNDQLSRLLLSSAWCSFRYNKVSGTSSTEKYRFFPNGTWNNGGRTETYNSGANGTVSGQYDSEGGGRWEVRGSQLFLSSAESPALQPVEGFSVTQNSNGYPIINADGKEFSSCN
jgi:hypothetical protein